MEISMQMWHCLFYVPAKVNSELDIVLVVCRQKSTEHQFGHGFGVKDPTVLDLGRANACR